MRQVGRWPEERPRTPTTLPLTTCTDDEDRRFSALPERADQIRSHFGGPSDRRLFVQPEMRSVVVVQVINTTPILLNSEKSGIRGIRGA